MDYYDNVIDYTETHFEARDKIDAWLEDQHQKSLDDMAGTLEDYTEAYE